MQNLENVYKQLQGLMPTAQGPVEAVPAAAVVLWRVPASAKIEIYLVKRAATMRFLPGFWSFPGGKLDSEDLGAPQGAVRELLEETGVSVEPGLLQPAGRWKTPSLAPMRFDTHYFLAELPAAQEPDVACSEGELEEGAWWQPSAALEAFAEGALLIPAPVLRVLRALVPGIEGAAERAVEQAAIEAMAPRLWELAGGVAVCPLRTPTLPPATHTNCYVIGTGELVVIDPATYEEAEREVLCEALDQAQSEGQRVSEVWLTHHHGDHIGSAEYISERYGVPIFAHRLTAERLRGVCRVDKQLEDGERRVLSGERPRELLCVFTPGHAPGHLCFYETHTRSLVAGDMVASQGTILIDPSEGDMAAYLDSLERIKSLSPRLLLPAHGMALSNPKMVIEHYLAHRLAREAQVLAALGSEPRSPAALVKQVYADTPPVLHGLAERSLLSHLIKLANEQRAKAVGDDWCLV